jgi:hypothetical protein
MSWGWRSSRAFAHLWQASGSLAIIVAAGVLAAAPGCDETGVLAQARRDHAAVLLADGRVLLCGGRQQSWDPSLESAEVFDPVTERSHSTGPMSQRRRSHTATLLQDGSVVVVGGDWSDRTVDRFDPATGTFLMVTNTLRARVFHTATRLQDGTVLVVGGRGALAVTPDPTETEIYDPVRQRFDFGPSLPRQTERHTATLLPDGQVLIAGGECTACPPLPTSPDDGLEGLGYQGGKIIAAYLYDPVSRTLSRTGNMTMARAGHFAMLLPTGRVLLVGGAWHDPRSVETYDPEAGTFAASGSLDEPHQTVTAAPLEDGRLLVADGLAAELYDPQTGSSASTGSLHFARSGHTMTPLVGGEILVAGGYRMPGENAIVYSSAELYDPATGEFSLVPAGGCTAGGTARLGLVPLVALAWLATTRGRRRGRRPRP